MDESVCTVTRMASVDGGDGVRLTLADFPDGEGRTLTVSADDFLALRLARGGMDADTLAAVTAAAGRYAALRAAIRMLGAGHCSRRRL